MNAAKFSFRVKNAVLQSLLINPEKTDLFAPRPGGKCIRFGAGRSGVRLPDGSYHDLVNWHCSLTRRGMCGRAAGTIYSDKTHHPGFDLPPIVNREIRRIGRDPTKNENTVL